MQAGVATLEDNEFDTAVERILKEQAALALSEAQIVEKLAMEIHILRANAAISVPLESIKRAVADKARDWDIIEISTTTHTVACGVMARYYVEGLISGGVLERG